MRGDIFALCELCAWLCNPIYNTNNPAKKCGEGTNTVLEYSSTPLPLVK